MGHPQQKTRSAFLLRSVLRRSGETGGEGKREAAWPSHDGGSSQGGSGSRGLSARCPALAGHTGAPIHPTGVTPPPWPCHRPAGERRGHRTPHRRLRRARSLPEPLRSHPAPGLLSESSVPCHLTPWSCAAPSDTFITYSMAFLLKSSSGNNSPMSDTVTN